MVRFTRHGFREMLIGSVVFLIVGFLVGFWSPRVDLIILICLLPLLAFLFAFFRDPERPIPTEQHLVVSPADGTVADITHFESDELLGAPGVRIGIFLSVFNVHVNRAPCDGRVVDIKYKEGKFINAMSHAAASSDNESNTIVLAEPKGDRRVAVVKQIVGLIARRIICTVKDGEVITRGQRIGMIKFGSRTELYLPQWLEPEVQVKVGQKVRGGADVIAALRKPIHTEIKASEDPDLEPLAPRETPA